MLKPPDCTIAPCTTLLACCWLSAMRAPYLPGRSEAGLTRIGKCHLVTDALQTVYNVRDGGTEQPLVPAGAQSELAARERGPAVGRNLISDAGARRRWMVSI